MIPRYAGKRPHALLTMFGLSMRLEQRLSRKGGGPTSSRSRTNEKSGPGRTFRHPNARGEGTPGQGVANGGRKEAQMGEKLDELKKAMVDLDLDAISPLVREALDAGEEPDLVLASMADGMAGVGELFEKGEYFLADLVLAGEGMKEGLEVLEPRLGARSVGRKGTVVLCTVKGDIHDIGKNLVGTMLNAAGFNVVDLGTDVGEERVVEAVRENEAGAIGLSVLLTPMVASISDVVRALEEAGLRGKVKIAIGGACTTPELVERTGVDAVGNDAVEAVRIFEGFF